MVFLMIFFTAGIERADASSNSVKPIKVPILMYHHIDEEVNSSVVVTPQKFENDVKLLKKSGYETIFLSDLVNYLNGKTSLPPKPIIITFDDGYSSFYTEAYPIAKKYNIKLTVGVIGWSIGEDSLPNSNIPIIPHFSYEEMKEMLNSGLVDVQNHTMDLHSEEGKSLGFSQPTNKGVLMLPNESEKDYELRLKKDLVGFNMEIFANTNHIPTFLVYPYGLYQKETEKIIYNLGFIGSLTTKPGVLTYKQLTDLQAMPRINIDNKTNAIKAIEKYK